MFQTVVDFFSKIFNPILPLEWRNLGKRSRDDEIVDLDLEDPPIKKQRMESIFAPSGSSYFPNPFGRRTNEKHSQTNEVIDLDKHYVTTISLLDDDTSISGKENVSTQVGQLSPQKGKSPQKNKYRAPSHCRSPHKSKFKNVSSRRGSEDILFTSSVKAADRTPDKLTVNNSKRTIFRRPISSHRKPFRSRSEQIMNSLTERNHDSVRSSAVFDIQSRMKYGELLGKVLKSPEMFSCRSPAGTTFSKIIDLTDNDDTGGKSSDPSAVGKISSKTPNSVIDLTVPASKSRTRLTSSTPKPSGPKDSIFDTDLNNENVIPMGTFVPHRRRVPPVNTLSTKLRHIPCANDEYISNLVSEIDKLKVDFEKDQEKVSKELSAMKPLRKMWEKVLEDRLKRHLKITCIDLDLDEDKEPVKPPLSDQMINTVMNAWDQRKPKGQVLVNNFNYQIKRSDLQTLSGLNWLNDEVINFYMELITVRGKQKDFPSVHTFSTFFYPKLEKDGYASLKRWTRKVDIFSFDLIVVPIHLRVHWCLAIIDLKKKSISYFDSMGHPNSACVNSLLKYLSEEHMDKKKESYDTSNWKLTCTKETVPQQMNSCDCGVFACTFAEYKTREADFTFCQEDMPYFRQKMTYEILSSQLLQWEN